jgi:Tol biopolymer transport system component
MTLSAGKRLGSYEILSIVGVGGMGEVYKARDTRLDRVVAIKVLPDHVASNPDLRSRFEREARAISSLSHPHICTLHDVGSEAGVEFLVMEFLEGETAAQRLEKGPIPIQQVLRYGVEIAEALDRAHRQGITHRDLKPGNVMLTKSGVKLLDFGLAKLRPVSVEHGAGSAPTAAADLTGSGTILGTLQYMAPEQVEGKAVDHRADIFALGAILYELATGKKAFEGGSQASLIGSILRDEPQPISALQPLSPPALDALVATCLAKDPDERWQSAADVGRQLRLMQGSSSSVQIGNAHTTRPGPSTRRTAVLAVAMLLAGAALATMYLRMFSRAAPAQPALVSRFTVVPPAPAKLTAVNPVDLDISRDGERIAYFAKTGDSTALYVRDLDRLEARALAQVSPESSSPFFTPDGASVVFRSAVEGLVRVAVDGGLRSKTGIDSLFGATMGPDGAFIYSDGAALYRIPAPGAEPERLTPTPESTASGTPPLYAAPRFLPDGRHLVYTLVDVNAGNEHVGSIDLDTREQSVLVEGAHPFFERSGYLLFVRGTTLMAAPFDSNRLAVTGAAVGILQGVRHPNIASAVDYSLSDNGTLIYVPSNGPSPVPRALFWVDRTGRVTSRVVDDPVDGARNPRLSPDGGRLLLTTGPLEEGDVWVYDLGGSPPIPLITDGDNVLGIWSRDGTRVAFMRGGSGAGFYNIVTIAADGRDRTPTAVTTGLTLAAPADFSSQGELILNRFVPPDIVTHRNGEQTVRDLVVTPDAETYPALSPDERWLAYVSNRTGRAEVWVIRYPDGNPIPISNGGGIEPRWSRDGTELYFRQGDAMMAVAVGVGGDRPFGPVTKLFEQSYLTSTEPTAWTYDVAPDGRFLMIEPTAPTQDAEAAIVVVQNFGEEIKRLMSAP